MNVGRSNVMKGIKQAMGREDVLIAGAVTGGIAPVLMNFCHADTTSTVMSKVVDKIYEIFKYVGLVLAIWGVGQLVLAFKNEDADSKSRAIMCIVSGVVLFGFESFTKGLGLTV